MPPSWNFAESAQPQHDNRHPSSSTHRCCRLSSPPVQLPYATRSSGSGRSAPPRGGPEVELSLRHCHTRFYKESWMHLICAPGSDYKHTINKRVYYHNSNQTYKSLTDTIFIYYTQTVDTKVWQQTITKWETSSSSYSTGTWLGIACLRTSQSRSSTPHRCSIWTVLSKGEHSYGWSSASGGNMQGYQG
jgi:hypothetical protein